MQKFHIRDDGYIVDEAGEFGKTHCIAQANLAGELLKALDTIANKPIGRPEASDREVLDGIVKIARTAIDNAERCSLLWARRLG